MNRSAAVKSFALQMATDEGGGGGGENKLSVEELTAQLAQATKDREDSIKARQKANREAEQLRGRLKSFADVARTFGGETEEEILANFKEKIASLDGRGEDNGNKPNAPPPGRTPAEDAVINQLKKTVEGLLADNKVAKDQLAAEKQEAAKTLQKTLIRETLADLAVPGHLAPAAFSFIRDPEVGNFRLDDEGNPIWSPRDLKTGKAVDLPFDKDSVVQYLPKEFLPAKGGGGSGGGSPRQVGSVKLKEMETLRSLVDGPHAQRDYEKTMAGKSDNEKAAIQREIQDSAVGNASE